MGGEPKDDNNQGPVGDIPAVFDDAANNSVDHASTTPAATNGKSAMRVWFEGLSPRDRAVAIGVMDGPFLATTCRTLLSSPSSSTTRIAQFQSLVAERDGAGTRVDVTEFMETIRSYEQAFAGGSWDLSLSTNTAIASNLVPSSEDNQVRGSPASENQAPLAATPTGTTDPAVAKKAVADNDAAPRSDNTPTEKDVFRIRSDEDIGAPKKGEFEDKESDDPSAPGIQGKKSAEAPATATTTTSQESPNAAISEDKPSPTTTTATTTTTTTTTYPTTAATIPTTHTTATTNIKSDDDFQVPSSVHDLFEHFCLVFPSVIHFASTKPKVHVQGHTPFFTLQTQFLQHKAGEEVMKALDTAIQTASPSGSFLPPDLFPSEWFHANQFPTVEEMCLHRLKTLMTDDKLSVPLFLILLVRLEVAVYSCYRNFVNHAYPANLTHAGGKGKVRKCKKFITSSSSCCVDTRVMNVLSSHGGAFGGMSSVMYADAVHNSLSPLMNVGIISTSKACESVTLDNLLFSPFGWLLRALANTAAPWPSLMTLDNAWKECVESVGQQLDAVKSSHSEPKTEAGNERKHHHHTDTGDVKPNPHASESSTKVAPGAEAAINKQTTAATSDWMDDNSAANPPTSTKKKRKKKKKKNKSAAGANVLGVKNSQSAPGTEILDDADKEVSELDKSAKDPDMDSSKGGKLRMKSKGARGENKAKSVAGKPDGEDCKPKSVAKTRSEAPKSKDEPVAEDNGKLAVVKHDEAGSKGTEEVKESVMEGIAEVSNTTPKLVESTEVVADVETVESSVKVASKPAAVPFSASQDTVGESSEDENENNDQGETNPEDGKKPSKADGDRQVGGGMPGKGDISLSHADGLDTVVAASAFMEMSDNPQSKVQPTPTEVEGESVDDSHDDWETVEVKGRGNRKKPGDRSNRLSGGFAGHSHNNGPKKAKSRTKETRKREKSRKLVKEILSSVLDSVDEEVRKRKRDARFSIKQPSMSSSSVGTARQENTSQPVGLTAGAKNQTLRDIVVGKQASSPEKRLPQGAAKSNVTSTNATSSNYQAGNPKSKEKKENESPTKRQGQAGADQNTAATVPETVSAVSDADGNRGVDSRRNARSTGLTRSDSSSGDSEAPQQCRTKTPTKAAKAASPAPPLPTLLSPGNANSSSSSVCSSLEAPHAGHARHHTSSSDEKAVGYHLLDVCDRLSKDMDEFMKRRSAALSSRRRERGALLGALQESVSSLWPSLCHVEMYGSCATFLDLPSSDLDVVVCGLDRVEVPVTTSPSPQKSLVSFVGSPNESGTPDESLQEPRISHHHISIPQYVPKHVNAERVVRLAAELEKQPWAVHVKAIPTASVPVVKVLADPSRLPGFASPHMDEGAWAPHAYQEEGGSPVENAEASSAPSTPGRATAATQGHQPSVSQFQPPAWRGADVINGLLSLDITFEGIEHGGIGSTEFSLRVVQDACNETGFHAEQTPIVQAIMVLKELLAQRRLNEPFSGGLSSYALLLLVLAVICERKVIREELDRVDRQRRLVAAGGCSSEYDSASSRKLPIPVNERADSSAPEPHTLGARDVMNVGNKGSAMPSPDITKAGRQSAHGTVASSETQNQPMKSPRVKAVTPSKGAPAIPLSLAPAKGPGSSWANIAKGQKGPGGRGTSKGNKPDAEVAKQNMPQTPKKPSSFADAVARMSSHQQQPSQPAKMQTAAQAKPPASAHLQKRPVPDSGEKSANKQQQTAKKEAAKTVPSLSKLADSSVLAKSSGRDEQHVNNEVTNGGERKIEADEETSKLNNYSSVPMDSGIVARESLFPQGFNDVIEVLCSGETTAGKLLMHFLLFYGQHFDAQATAIDISGKHPREPVPGQSPYSHLSPYIQRRSAGTIDPVTGMLTVDPIIVYDPLEGAENNNVARRCFLWSNVRWVFAQSYMTLSSAVELNPTPPTTPGTGTRVHSSSSRRTYSGQQGQNVQPDAAWKGPYNPDDKASPFDPSSPLLELLLSY